MCSDEFCLILTLSSVSTNSKFTPLPGVGHLKVHTGFFSPSLYLDS